jgi:hypothetical protein
MRRKGSLVEGRLDDADEKEAPQKGHAASCAFT